ncbi:hypothetical protein RYX36_022982, partial [Vicia faba]
MRIIASAECVNLIGLTHKEKLAFWTHVYFIDDKCKILFCHSFYQSGGDAYSRSDFPFDFVFGSGTPFSFRTDIAWGKQTHGILDVEYGVARFGSFLFQREVLAMTFALKDEHEAHVQFALERGIPDISILMDTKRLLFPAR